MAYKRIFILILYFNCYCAQDKEKFKIGAIFYEDDVDLKTSLELSVENSDVFDVDIQMVPRGFITPINTATCTLAKNKVIGIIDGVGGRASEHIQALCDILELPHVLINHNDYYDPSWSQLNLYPSSASYNLLLNTIITQKEWDSYILLYVKGHSLLSVEDLMKMGNYSDLYSVAVRELSGDDYRDVLTEAKNCGFVNFVVDCPSIKLNQVLDHAQQVGLMSDEHSYIFLSPDLFTLDLSSYRYGGANITGFRLIDTMENPSFWEFADNLNTKTETIFKAEEIKTNVVLVYDSVQVFYEATKKIEYLYMEELSCETYSPWIYGSSLLNFMRTNKVEGLTRSIIFDGYGQRHDFKFDVLELTPAGNQTIGKWENREYYPNRPLISSGDINEESIMKNKTFKILIATTKPYGYITASSEKLSGNDRYEGFTIDLIKEISIMLGFNYEFEEENKYGNKIDGKWNGMVLKIMEERAEFGICDFTITADRQSAIDFSTPFLTLGIGILYKEPSKQPPEMFSFMAVFTQEVWIGMLLIQFMLGMIMIFVGRISHKEWQNPVPCIEVPEELNNQFSFSNSIWLIFGSVVQQGTEIAPIAPAPRLITSVWWFFTMVMVASYTGTLVAFLVVENNVMPFNDLHGLAESKIAYGAKESGSTIQFFNVTNDSFLSSMFNKMKVNKWLVAENDDGVERAQNSPYAFFMESASIEYYTERYCDLRQVGGLLDSKSYGIGMKKGSPYKKYIDNAILRLKETGVIQKLKDIWWKEKRGGGKCQDRKNEETKKLGMKNMIGAFVVLGVGCLIGLLISILDMMWGVFKRTVKYRTTFRYELIEELKFALKFSGDIKPVKRPDRPGIKSSVKAIAEVEGRDELKSLRSARSTDTHRTHHSHSSRHSSRSQSVAFARRREYT